jgi:outer membrane protein assembly factor BamB
MTKVTNYMTNGFMKRVKKTFSNSSIRAISIALLFLLSGIGGAVLINPAAAVPNHAGAIPAAPSAAAPTPLTQAQANWEYPNGNAFAQDYNPQNQINSSNAQYLGLSWIYPLPTLPTQLTSLAGLYSGASVQTSILVVNGTAIAMTEYDEIFAFNLANGNILWTYLTPLAPNQTAGESTGPVPLHSHDGNIWFTTASFGSGVHGPTYWFQGQNNRVYAVSVINGKQELNFSDFTGLSMVPGNNPASVYNGIGASNIIINEKLGVLVSGHDAETDAANGRGFFAGWNVNVNPPKLMWVTPDVPPQPGSPGTPLNPNFDTQQIANMTGAYTFFPGKGGANGYTTPAEIAGGVLTNVNDSIVVNWKNLPPGVENATLYNDWGQSFQSAQCLGIDGGSSTGSTGSGWGGAWLVGHGKAEGIAYVASNNKDPYVGPCTPGPDLWSAATLALNMTTGQIIWGFQANAHDLWDWDCSWYQALANETLNGVNTPVVLKTCKNGYYYEINGLTGDLVWAWSPPSGVVTPGAARCPVCYMWNPLNSSQMQFEWPQDMISCASVKFALSCINGPPSSQQPFYSWPSAIAGFEGEQAYDPVTNQIFATSHIIPAYIGYLGLNASTYYTSPGMNFGQPCPQCGTIDNNSTTWAINAATGSIIWHFTQPNEGYRGKTVVSGGVIYLTESSGDILMVNESNGKLLDDFYVGAPMDEGVSFGASINGTEYMVLSVGVCDLEAVATCPGTTPGDVLALTLEHLPATHTTTVVSASTVTTTSVSVSTSTATISGNGQVSTSTVIVTASGVSGGGVSTTTAYGLAALAVVFIIATGYFATRSRKPST